MTKKQKIECLEWIKKEFNTKFSTNLDWELNGYSGNCGLCDFERDWYLNNIDKVKKRKFIEFEDEIDKAYKNNGRHLSGYVYWKMPYTSRIRCINRITNNVLGVKNVN